MSLQKLLSELRERNVADLKAEHAVLGGERGTGLSEDEYAELFADKPEMLDGLESNQVAHENQRPRFAALSREYDRAGGEKKLGISRDEYVAMFEGKLTEGLR